MAATTSPRKQPVYHFYCGKGGVGKTTLAAAAARRHAAAGRRVLAVSTDPAHSLGDALGAPLGGTPRRLRSRRGRLEAAELDAAAGLEHWLRPRRAAFERALLRGTLLDRQDVARLLQLSWPGIDELVALVEIERLAEGASGPSPIDLVVVDTAPTGHTWRLFEAAENIGSVATVLDAMLERDREIAAAVGGRAARDLADALVDELAAQADRLAARLRDGRATRIMWVTLAEPVAVAEALDAVAWLRARHLPLAEVIVNRSAGPRRGCRTCRARAALERAALGPLRRAARGVPFRFVPDRKAVAAVVPLRTRRSSLRAKGRKPATLAQTLKRLKLLIVAGKGGVGKTTVAATLAIAAATGERRRRVLLLSADPAHSLGDVLAVRLGDEVRRLRNVEGSLDAREVDAAAVFARERAELKGALARTFPEERSEGVRIDLARDREALERLLEVSPPGVDEIVALISVIEALDPYDLIVLDTAPTGHALKLLRMPDEAGAWLAELMRLLLKYRDVLRVSEIAESILRLSRGVRRLKELLRDASRAQVVAVTRAAELPRLETERLLDALEALGLKTTAVVVNAVTPFDPLALARGMPLGLPRCPRCRAALRVEEVEILRLAGSRSSLAEAAGRTGREGCDIIVAPLVLPPPRGVLRLARWMERWACFDA